MKRSLSNKSILTFIILLLSLISFAAVAACTSDDDPNNPVVQAFRASIQNRALTDGVWKWGSDTLVSFVPNQKDHKTYVKVTFPQDVKDNSSTLEKPTIVALESGALAVKMCQDGDQLSLSFVAFNASLKVTPLKDGMHLDGKVLGKTVDGDFTRVPDANAPKTVN